MNNLSKVVAQQRRGRASNPRLLDRKSDVLPLSHRATPAVHTKRTSCYNKLQVYTFKAVVCHFQVFCHMSVAWIRLFHFRIRNTYLAVRPNRTSGTDTLQDIFEATHVLWIASKFWEFFLILETSCRVRHSTVDRLWDDDRLAGQTSRSERLWLAELFLIHRHNCISVSINATVFKHIAICIFNVNLQWHRGLNVSHAQYSSLWFSPIEMTANQRYRLTGN